MNLIEKSKVKDTKCPRSSLPDTIYRSIDESKVHEEDLSYFRETIKPKKKQNNNLSSKLDSLFKQENERTNLGQAIMIENWVEKQSIRSSSLLSNSGSSSYESSYGVAWSSSETESNSNNRSKPKQLKTKVSVFTKKFEESGLDKILKPKTKLKDQKIYGGLKKVKQPISPGSRIASFINSIFNSGNIKKAKTCYVGAVEDVNSEHVSKSASTFSRSCLSKPTLSSSYSSSRSTKQSNGVKRSVRFYPVSVILGEEDPSLMPLPTTQNFVRNYSVNKDHRFNNEDLADNEDDSDDLGSDSSSDLFEIDIDHLMGINGRYREELDVYETTNVKTYQPLAKGFNL